jgi:hypothetical protein
MKTKTLYTILILAALVLLVNSCEFYCIEGNGIVQSEHRLVTEFTGIENTTSFDVDVIADSVFVVEVTADENILPLVRTSVRGHDLIIDTDNGQCFRNSHKVSINIHMPDLEYVESNGSGNMDVDNFDCDALEVRNSGSGDIDMTNISIINKVEINVSGSGDVSITGKAREGDYHLSGSGDISAEGMRLDECYASNSGSGDIKCFAYYLLNAILNGSGDILYYTVPDELIQEDNGSGDIRRIY